MQYNKLFKYVIDDDIKFLKRKLYIIKNKYGDETYVEYHYSTKRYGKVNAGDIFVYRRPQKTSPNKRFYLFGGGVINEVLPKENGQQGDVIAKITYAFEFEEHEEILCKTAKFELKFDADLDVHTNDSNDVGSKKIKEYRI